VSILEAIGRRRLMEVPMESSRQIKVLEKSLKLRRVRQVLRQVVEMRLITLEIKIKFLLLVLHLHLVRL
jgi:hypothetical protein